MSNQNNNELISILCAKKIITATLSRSGSDLIFHPKIFSIYHLLALPAVTNT